MKHSTPPNGRHCAFHPVPLAFRRVGPVQVQVWVRPAEWVSNRPGPRAGSPHNAHNR